MTSSPAKDLRFPLRRREIRLCRDSPPRRPAGDWRDEEIVPGGPVLGSLLLFPPCYSPSILKEDVKNSRGHYINSKTLSRLCSVTRVT